MVDITLKNSIIHCGPGSFEKYAPALAEKKPYIITDKNVFGLYRRLLWETFGNDAPIKILPAGESAKTLRYFTEIIGDMADCGVTRDSTVIAFGGGVVGDIAGLAAALYMRGVKLVQIPTTLLAQVDSSVGGKTAVDFKKIKNLIGTFYQPEEVIIDGEFLRTLPAREIRCGLGEIIKYGALNREIYQKLVENSSNLQNFGFLEDITVNCIRHKADIVSRDERDLSGLRKTLNLGHTTGHAFELSYGRKSHGEFVLIGMYYEIYIAEKLGLGDLAYLDELKLLIKSIIKKIPSFENAGKAAETARYDKKNSSDKAISLIVPVSEGKSQEVKLPLEEYVKLIEECAKSL